MKSILAAWRTTLSMQKQMSGFYSDQQQFVTFLCLTKGGKKTPGKTVRMQNIPP